MWKNSAVALQGKVEYVEQNALSSSQSPKDAQISFEIRLIIILKL